MDFTLYTVLFVKKLNMKCNIQTLFGLCGKYLLKMISSCFLKKLSKWNFKDSDFYILVFIAALFIIVKTSAHEWIKQFVYTCRCCSAVSLTLCNPCVCVCLSYTKSDSLWPHMCVHVAYIYSMYKKWISLCVNQIELGNQREELSRPALIAEPRAVKTPLLSCPRTQPMKKPWTLGFLNPTSFSSL